MKIGLELIIGILIGAAAMFLLSFRYQIGNSLELATLNGKISVLNQYCPNVVEKAGIKVGK